MILRLKWEEIMKAILAWFIQHSQELYYELWTYNSFIFHYVWRKSKCKFSANPNTNSNLNIKKKESLNIEQVNLHKKLPEDLIIKYGFKDNEFKTLLLKLFNFINEKIKAHVIIRKHMILSIVKKKMQL